MFVTFCILLYPFLWTNSQCLLQPLKCPSSHVARCARQTAGTPLAEPWTATAWNRIASVFLSRYTCKVQTYTYLIIFTSFYRYACAWRCIKTGAFPNQSETCNRPNGQRLVWVNKNLLYRLYPVWIITPLGCGLWGLHIRIWPIRILAWLQNQTLTPQRQQIWSCIPYHAHHFPYHFVWFLCLCHFISSWS